MSPIDPRYGAPGSNIGLIYLGVPAYRANGDLVLLATGRVQVRFVFEGKEIETVFDLLTGRDEAHSGWAVLEESRARLLALAPPAPSTPPAPEKKTWKKVSTGRRKRR